MNQLPFEKRCQIVRLLVEGNSLRSISRIADIAFNTVLKFVPTIGKACERFHYETVRGVTSKRVQCDEIWSFTYAKQKNVTGDMKGHVGDTWTWVGMDADSKLVISWFVGNRGANSAYDFMQDIAARLANRVQLTTDGHKPYLEAVEEAFGAAIDYAQLVKIYGADSGHADKKYSPAECIGAKKFGVTGHPDPKYVSTSYVERQNLTMRMSMRRFTRLTNGFSKKIDNHCYAIALHYVYYNFCRIHKSLRVTPAMESGLTKKLWDVQDIVKLIDQYKED